MSRPVFVFHIGPGKTGSSSIQHALRTNEEALNSAGIFYVKSYQSAAGDHHPFAELMYRIDNGSLEAAVELKKYVDDLKIFSETNPVTKLVVSSDLLANCKQQSLSILAELLSTCGFGVKVVAYCRNVYSLALSTLQQQIQNGKHLIDFYSHKPFTYFHPIFTNAQAFGWNNIELRAYQSTAEKNWSVVGDFMNDVLFAGIQHINEQRVNISLLPAQLQYLNYFNHLFRYPTPHGNIAFAEIFRWAVLNMQPPHTAGLSMSPAEARAMAEYIIYDEELFSSLLPSLSPYKMFDISTAPPHIIGAGFTETVCAPPSAENLHTFLGAMSSFASHPDLISQLKQ